MNQPPHHNHSDPMGATKPCARCGVDCTSIPRVKDDKGRYFCRACYDRAIAQMASQIIQTAPVLPRQEHSSSAPHHDDHDDHDDLDQPADILGTIDSHDAHIEGRDGARPLSDETYELAIPEHVRVVPTKDCPSCAKEIREADTTCRHCGFNMILNQEADEALPVVTATFTKGNPHCGSCGYSLLNLGSTTCPECGSPNRIPNRSHWDQEDSDAIARRQVVRPGVYLGIGLVGFIVLAFIERDPVIFFSCLVVYAINLPAVIGAFFACCFLWLGFNDSAKLVVWKLAGILALTSLVLFSFSLLAGGVGIIPLIIVGFVFTGLLYVELDVDQSDAWLMGLGLLIAQVGTSAIIAAVLRKLGWI